MRRSRIDYGRLVESALRTVVREVLERLGKEGVSPPHHFYITFRTHHPGVAMPEFLRDRYPVDMTIVLQHQFWDLEVDEHAFAVTLSFNDQLHRMRIPFSAIKVFTWVGTFYRGSISFRAPLLYFFEFLFLFGVGGTTGVALASMSLDIHWHDTYFIVAHFHFIMVGATMTAFLAAIHYWFPKMWGREYPERLGLLSAVLVFMGFTGTFLPQFLLGNAGMPRRYSDYPPRFELLHVLLANAGRVLPRETLIDRVWGNDYVGDTKTLDVHVKRLRSKIEPDPAAPSRIVTIRGLGYKYERR